MVLFKKIRASGKNKRTSWDNKEKRGLYYANPKGKKTYRRPDGWEAQLGLAGPRRSIIGLSGPLLRPMPHSFSWAMSQFDQ